MDQEKMREESEARRNEELRIIEAIEVTMDTSEKIAAMRQMAGVTISRTRTTFGPIWAAAHVDGSETLARINLMLRHTAAIQVMQGHKVFRSFRKRADGTFNVPDIVERFAEAFLVGFQAQRLVLEKHAVEQIWAEEVAAVALPDPFQDDERGQPWASAMRQQHISGGGLSLALFPDRRVGFTQVRIAQFRVRTANLTPMLTALSQARVAEAEE